MTFSGSFSLCFVFFFVEITYRSFVSSFLSTEYKRFSTLTLLIMINSLLFPQPNFCNLKAIEIRFIHRLAQTHTHRNLWPMNTNFSHFATKRIIFVPCMFVCDIIDKSWFYLFSTSKFTFILTLLVSQWNLKFESVVFFPFIRQFVRFSSWMVNCATNHTFA